METQTPPMLRAAAMAAIVCLGLGCAALVSPPLSASSPAPSEENTAAGENESEIAFNRPSQYSGNAYGMHILIDGKKHLDLTDGGSGTIVVPNGKHTVRAVHPMGAMFSGSNVIQIGAASNRIEFEARYGNGEIILNKLSEVQLDAPDAARPALARASAGRPRGLDEAIKKAITSLMDDLPKGAAIAVININSDDGGVSSAALSEVEFHLVSAKSFTIVDRNTLDAVRREQELQMSGDVSDASIVAIGNLAGAGVVITGDISETGKNRRFALKALDVKTGQIISMARETY